MRHALFCLLLLSLPLRASQITQEEYDFLTKRLIKTLLDPKAEGSAVLSALNTLRTTVPPGKDLPVDLQSGSPGSLPLVAQIVPDLRDKLPDRWERCLYALIEAGRHFTPKGRTHYHAHSLHDKLVPDYARLLVAGKLTNRRLEVIEFLELLGPRAKAALPVLRQVRDHASDNTLAVAAFRLVQRLEGSK